MKICLVSVDCQKDFTLPGAPLYVPGAEENAKRTAKLIRQLGAKLTHVVASLDSHARMDISHPLWWRDANGKHPEPFTQISVQDVGVGRWSAKDSSSQALSLRYLRELESRGRHQHTIWPEHCIIGTRGQQLNDDLQDALLDWEEKTRHTRTTVYKGMNPWTEHFSAIEAEVPDPGDPSTTKNEHVIRIFEEFDLTLWTGEALSHCVAQTFLSALRHWQLFNYQGVGRQVILTDATSSVPGFEALGEDFLKEATAAGAQVSTTDQVLRLYT